VRAVMMLEGISRQLDPDFDIFAVSAPFAVRMMLTFPNPGLRQRLMAEMLTGEGQLNWDRVQQLAGLVVRDNGFRLQTEGLVEPALDMLLSPEGSALRRALVADLLHGSHEASQHARQLATLLSVDPTLSGRRILDRLVAFLFSPEGEETKKQLAAGLRLSGGGSLDLTRIGSLASLARQLHPDFRAGTVLRAMGGYLLSDEGKPARNGLFLDGTGRLVGALVDRLDRLVRPSPLPTQTTAFPRGKEKAKPVDA